jgi:hypothetical protein
MITRGRILALVGVAALSACHPTERGSGAGRVAGDAGTPVDTEVMAFLSEARALHHQANLRESAGDGTGATEAIDRLVRAERPHPAEKIPEVEEVLADAFARLAELHLARRDVEGALHAVDQGLAHAPSPTYFRGHLLEVQGIIEEARAAELADAGKKDDSAKARAHASELLQEAVRVQEQVIGRALGDGGAK